MTYSNHPAQSPKNLILEEFESRLVYRKRQACELFPCLLLNYQHLRDAGSLPRHYLKNSLKGDRVPWF